MSKILITPLGMEKLRLELESLKNQRKEVISAINDARSLGDLSENGEYSAAKEKQGMIDRKIREIETMVLQAEEVEISKYTEQQKQNVRFGASITIENAEGRPSFYKIVGITESDPKAGYISIASPIAQSLLGKGIGDDFYFESPKGKQKYKITDIQYID